MSDVNDVVERLIALRDAFRPAPGAGPQTVGLEGYRALVTGNTLAAIYDACALINTLSTRLAQAERDAARWRWLRSLVGAADIPELPDPDTPEDADRIADEQIALASAHRDEGATT